jgi:hypothetical protein
MTSPTILDKMTCAWCDANGSQQKCYRCKDGCRQPNLAERPPNGSPRVFNMNVTPTNSFLPRVIRRNGAFVTVNGCCSSLTAGAEFAFPNDRSDTHGIYQWRRYDREHTSTSASLRTCSNPSFPDVCYIYGPITRCQYTHKNARACVLGWRQIALITSATLYISRTQPRYGCGEENQCNHRLSLVIDGQIGVTWATQNTQGSTRTLDATAPFCELPHGCVGNSSSNWPVGSPPAFRPDLVSVTMHNFRQVFRRSVSELQFPMVFNAGNAVSVACGPQCAEAFSGFGPTFGNPPEFVCSPLDDLPPVFGDDLTNYDDCLEAGCEDLCAGFIGGTGFINTRTGGTNTFVSSTDSGVTTDPDSKPNTTLPTEYTVELW